MQKGTFFSLISATAFGALAILFKFGYDSGLTTGTMLSFRFIFAVMILLPYVLLYKRNQLLLSKKLILMAFIGGSIFYGAQSYCFAAAVQLTSASTASLILYLYPMTVVLTSALLFKTKVTIATSITLVFITIGFVCVFYDAFSRNMNLYGLLLAFMATLIFTAYMLLIQKSLNDVDPIVFSFYILSFAALQCIFTYSPFDNIEFTSYQWLIMFLIAFVSTVVAVVFLYKAIELIGSAYASIFSSIEPAVTVILAATVLGDAIAIIQIIGMISIIAGIALPNIIMLKKKNT